MTSPPPTRRQLPSDPDPRYVAPEPVRRQVDEDRSGMVIVWIVGAALVVIGTMGAVAVLAWRA